MRTVPSDGHTIHTRDALEAIRLNITGIPSFVTLGHVILETRAAVNAQVETTLLFSS